MAVKRGETDRVSFNFRIDGLRLICHRSARVISNNAGHDETGKRWNWSQVWEALRDPQTWFVFASTFLSNIPNGYVSPYCQILLILTSS